MKKVDQSLCDAAFAGHLSAVQQAIKGGANVNCHEDVGWFPLFLAAQKGSLPVVRYLLADAGANVEEALTNRSGSTAMHVACVKGHLEIVRFLAEEGKASVQASNKLGRTPLMHASIKGHKDVVQYLLEHTSAQDTVTTDQTGGTALHMACREGHMEVVEMLVKSQTKNSRSRSLDLGDEEKEVSSANRPDKHGWTPIMYATRGGHKQVVKYLMDEGSADSTARTSSIMTGVFAETLVTVDGGDETVYSIEEKKEGEEI